MSISSIHQFKHVIYAQRMAQFFRPGPRRRDSRHVPESDCYGRRIMSHIWGYERSYFVYKKTVISGHQCQLGSTVTRLRHSYIYVASQPQPQPQPQPNKEHAMALYIMLLCLCVTQEIVPEWGTVALSAFNKCWNGTKTRDLRAPASSEACDRGIAA